MWQNDTTIAFQCYRPNSVKVFYSNQLFLRFHIFLNKSELTEMTCHDTTGYDMTWHDMTWPDMTWHVMTQQDMTWHDMTWPDMTWHVMTQQDMTWHDMTWYAMTMTWHLNITWHHMTWSAQGTEYHRCLSPFPNWDPPPPLPQASMFLPPEPKGGGHVPAGNGVRWRDPNSDDWRKSLDSTLSTLCPTRSNPDLIVIHCKEKN